MESLSELFEQVLYQTTDELYCQLPAKVVAVHNNYVDILLYINDSELDFVIYNVPIQRPETQRAYIFLGIKEGDRGVCRFFDRSVEGYLQSDFDYNSDDRQHDINDRCFELGFIPDKEAYIYPDNIEIEIGLKDQSAKISFNNGVITIVAENIIKHGNVNQTGNNKITGTLMATNIIAEDGATGSIVDSQNKILADVENGIIKTIY